MMISRNGIDEINIFNNGDGSYSVELYMCTTEGEHFTVKMPRSALDMNLTSSYKGTSSIELKLEGTVNSI